MINLESLLNKIKPEALLSKIAIAEGMIGIIGGGLLVALGLALQEKELVKGGSGLFAIGTLSVVELTSYEGQIK